MAVPITPPEIPSYRDVAMSPHRALTITIRPQLGVAPDVAANSTSKVPVGTTFTNLLQPAANTEPPQEPSAILDKVCHVLIVELWLTHSL